LVPKQLKVEKKKEKKKPRTPKTPRGDHVTSP
jgi:hypothetical protein